MAELTLFADNHWISPYVFSCFVALKEKALDFDVETVSLSDRAQHDPAYAAATITGRVPALRHRDFWLAESSAIVEYLDDAFPDAPRLMPADVRDRARARQVLGWVRSDLGALREERPTTTMFYAKATAPLSEAGEAAAAKLLRVAEALVPAVRPTLFACGFTSADADLAFMLTRLVASDHDVPQRLRAYVAAQWARPSVQAFVSRERAPYRPY